MRYKCYIDIGNGYEQCYPDFIDRFKITRKTGTDEVEKYFYRINWGKVQFSNNPRMFKLTNNNVYRLFEFINNIEFGFDTEILIKYITDNHTIVGYFGRNDCTFDYDRKILTVEPSVIDEYTVIVENMENAVGFNEFNFSNPPVSIEITENALKTISDWPYPSVTIGGEPNTPRNRIKEDHYRDNGGLYLYFDGNKPKEELYMDEYYMFEGIHVVWSGDPNVYGTYNLQNRIDILGQDVTPDNMNDISVAYGDYELSKFRVYEGTRVGGLSGNKWRQIYCETWFSREEVVKEAVPSLDNPFGFVSPIGEGWNMRQERVKNGKPAHLWTRRPYGGAYTESWGVPVEVENNGTYNPGWNWYKYLESSLQYDNSTNSIQLVTTVNLRDFFEHILRGMHPDLSNMEFKSTFLFNDFESELEVLKGTTGYNYVSGTKNYLNGLKIFFTRDLTSPEEDEIANYPEYTLADALDELNNIFANKLTWFIDSNGYFRIEHVRWVDLRKTSYDIRGSELLNFTTYWKYDKTKMFERYEFIQANAGYPDFTNNTITFDKIISNNRNSDSKKVSAASDFTTDARYCILNPGDIKEGLIIIAVDENNVVMNKTGIISNIVETNGFMAISNILLDFGRYEGMWHTGKINSILSQFTVTERNKLGIELKISGVHLSVFYTTQIGIGLIDDGTIDFENENTSIILRYRYNSAVTGDVFALAFQKATDFVGANNNWADIDNYIITN